MHLNNLKKLKPLTWKEVFQIWKTSEADNPSWQKTARDMGFPDWQSWRLFYADHFHLPKLGWSLYKIEKPLETIPDFLGGPFRKWVREIYQSKLTPPFKEIVKNPKVQENKKIINLAKEFPEKTELIGVIKNNQVVIVEGMHRCCAVELKRRKNEKLHSQINIALANYPYKISTTKKSLENKTAL